MTHQQTKHRFWHGEDGLLAGEAAADLERQWAKQESEIRARILAPGKLDRASIGSMSGLEGFESMLAGRSPPPSIGFTLGFLMVEAQPGCVIFQGRPQDNVLNPMGTVHGGYAATMLDSALACAVQSLMPKGKASTTLELKVNYVRPMMPGGALVRAEGRVIQMTKQTGLAEGRLYDAAGRLYAFATTTCMLFDLA